MNKLIKQLAEEAGFCFWSDEPWKPVGAEIDWSSNYDDAFERFLRILKRELLLAVDASDIDDDGDHVEYLRYRITQLLEST